MDKVRKTKLRDGVSMKAEKEISLVTNWKTGAGGFCLDDWANSIRQPTKISTKNKKKHHNRKSTSSVK